MKGFEKYTDYKTVLTVNALIWCDGKFLMLKRADDKKIDPGLYGGIGGKVEPHESFYDALHREIEEETGIKELGGIRLYSVTQHPFPPTNAEWVNLYFIVKIAKQVKVEPMKEGTFHWIDPKEIDNYPTPTDTKEYIKILNDNPEAFILGFFDHNDKGDLTEKSIKIL